MRQLLLCLSLALLYATSARAQFDYPNFARQDNLTLINTIPIAGEIHLSQARRGGHAGAMWHVSKQQIEAGFISRFRFRITEMGGAADPNGPNGGDGIAFVIQNFDPEALGISGYGIGYHGISNSLAIELDTWDDTLEFNSKDGPNHLAIHSNGVLPNSAIPDRCAVYANTFDIPNLSDQFEHEATIFYVPGWLAVYLDDCKVPALTLRIDLDTLLQLDNGTAWVGLTAGTQSAWERHRILSWSFGPHDLCPILDTLVVRDTVKIRDTTRLVIRDTIRTVDTVSRTDTVFVGSAPDTVRIIERDTLTLRDTVTVRDTILIACDSTLFLSADSCRPELRGMETLEFYTHIVSVYPNPGAEAVTIEYEIEEGPHWLELYTTTGERALAFDVPKNPGRFSVVANVTSAGRYLVILRSSWKMEYRWLEAK